MTKRFNLGELVIVNSIDLPAVRLLAVIDHIDEGDGKELPLYSLLYMGANTSIERLYSNLVHANSLKEFGLEFYYEACGLHSRGCVRQRGESTATYPNGKPRDWQEIIGQFTTLRLSALEVYRRYEEINDGA